jgi:carbamoyltransferase
VNILGISGVDGTVEFKRRHWPGLDEREYRISQGHDSAAALVVDGRCVAAVAEERITRRKHTGDFPTGAARACLESAGLGPHELDEVVHSFDYAPYRTAYSLDPYSRSLYDEVLSREAFGRHARTTFPDLDASRIRHVDHHLAHAASAALTSGWEKCVVVVADGMGEAHAATAYTATDGHIEPLFRIPASASIGILYSVVTLHLGFDFNADEYKIMGLAPYGDPARFTPFFDAEVLLRDGGMWDIPALRLNRTRDEREFHAATRAYLAEHLVEPRAADEPIEQVHEDVAAALQACLDRAIVHLCAAAAGRSGLSRLALAGGVALNTTANAKLQNAGLFDEIYIQPAAADDGSALGAALWRAAAVGKVANRRLPVPFLGPAHSANAVREAVQTHQSELEATEIDSFGAVCAAAAELIMRGEVVAWFRSRMEFGPRALGHRSILADPSRHDMRDRVNQMIKMREAFRPFAPAVSLEQVSDWFDVAPRTELPYMVVNVQVRDEHRSSLPAVCHVDGSARVQTVSAVDNEDFHALLRAVGAATGREVVLNTSFNVKGQPIVNTPLEAVETFLGTGLDALFLEDFLVRKRR